MEKARTSPRPGPPRETPSKRKAHRQPRAFAAAAARAAPPWLLPCALPISASRALSSRPLTAVSSPASPTRVLTCLLPPNNGRLATPRHARAASFIDEAKRRKAAAAKTRDLNKLDQDEIMFLKEQFQKYDKDRSGDVDVRELGPLMQDFGVELTPAAVNVLLADAATRKRGRANLNEFLTIMMPYIRPGRDPNGKDAPDLDIDPEDLYDLKREFSRLDRDGNGVLTVTEMGGLMRAKSKLSMDEVRRLQQKYDRDHDGCLSFNEFVALAYDNNIKF